MFRIPHIINSKHLLGKKFSVNVSSMAFICSLYFCGIYFSTNDTPTYKNEKSRTHSVSSEVGSPSFYIVCVRNRNYISGLSDGNRKVFLVKEKIL